MCSRTLRRVHIACFRVVPVFRGLFRWGDSQTTIHWPRFSSPTYGEAVTGDSQTTIHWPRQSQPARENAYAGIT